MYFSTPAVTHTVTVSDRWIHNNVTVLFSLDSAMTQIEVQIIQEAETQT